MNSGCVRFWLGLGVALWLAGCASLTTPPASDDPGVTPWAQSSLAPHGVQPWRHLPLPGKRATSFKFTPVDGRDALEVLAESSASMMRKQVRIEPKDVGQLHFSWKVRNLIASADLAARDADDAPVRLVLAFEGDRSRFSPKNALLSELARAMTGEEMPYATLMYVWCNVRAPESVVHNPRTDRIRKIVVESGEQRLGQWLDYSRDVRADFIQAFGEEPGALVAIGVMTDSDNTGSVARAWYGPLQMVPPLHAAH